MNYWSSIVELECISIDANSKADGSFWHEDNSSGTQCVYQTNRLQKHVNVEVLVLQSMFSTLHRKELESAVHRPRGSKHKKTATTSEAKHHAARGLR